MGNSSLIPVCAAETFRRQGRTPRAANLRRIGREYGEFARPAQVLERAYATYYGTRGSRLCRPRQDGHPRQHTRTGQAPAGSFPYVARSSLGSLSAADLLTKDPITPSGP